MEFYLADYLYDPEEELFITIYATLDGSKVLKVRRLSMTVQHGLPLHLPDNWKYPEGVREISTGSLRFYYRQKAEAAQHRISKGEPMMKVQPTL